MKIGPLSSLTNKFIVIILSYLCLKNDMGRPSTFISLSEPDKAFLTNLVKTGHHGSRQLQRARILLLNAKGEPVKHIMSLLDLSRPCVSYCLSDYRSGGLQNALNDKPRSGAPRKITANLEAHVTAISCTDSPEGTARWTLSLLKDEVIRLNYVDTISDESIRTILKKVNSNLGYKSIGVLAR
jgi:putative transposase